MHDLNDRALRNIVCGLGGKVNGVPREDGFDISVASEVMAILCLATSLDDLKERAGRMIVAYDYDGNPVTVNDIEATGAVTLLLKDAIKPNLVQTLDHTPVFVHGGPFANIAHGCNSVMATKLAIKLGDYAITEAGFGADLGAEKFLDIKCRQADLDPQAVVIVATVRALKMHGGVDKKELANENLEALAKGVENLEKHSEVKDDKRVFLSGKFEDYNSSIAGADINHEYNQISMAISELNVKVIPLIFEEVKKHIDANPDASDVTELKASLEAMGAFDIKEEDLKGYGKAMDQMYQSSKDIKQLTEEGKNNGESK